MASNAVQVAVRVRPMNDREKGMNSKLIIEMNGQSTVIRNPAITDPKQPGYAHAFSFDYSYWSYDNEHETNAADQQRVFLDLGTTILDNAFAGFNVSIFAYGQTGSGKSYSMLGYGEDKGLIPRVCDEMFKRVEKLTSQSPDVTVQIEVSFMEIYNEMVFDLLNPSSAKKGGLKVRNHPKTGPYVDNLSRLAVNVYPEIEELMDEGSKSRTVASTNMNAQSSRSHAVFTILLTQQKGGEGGSTIVSKIHMVDLAGSERATATGASGDRLREGANINKSLSTLGKVISALAKKSEGKSGVFVPYRDSVLTWLLKESLGGNSKTIMLAALSPADVNYEETLSTLRYADSAKQIKNTAVVNEDPTQKLIRELNEEIERLKTLLAEKEVALQQSASNAVQSTASGISEVSENGELTADSIQTNGTAPSVHGDLTLTSSLSPEDITSATGLDEIKSQLEQDSRLVLDLSKTWDDRRKETEQIQKDRVKTLSRMGISTEDASSANLPRLVNLNQDPLLSGALIYYLQPGETKLGSGEELQKPRIQLLGLGVAESHCTINHKDNGEVLVIKDGTGDAHTYVNGARVKHSARLRDGDRVIIGNNNAFVFLHPEDRARRESEGNVSPRRAAADYTSAMSERAAAEVDSLLAYSLKFDLNEEEERQLEQTMRDFASQKTAEKDQIKESLAELKKAFEEKLQSIPEEDSGARDAAKQDYEQKLQDFVAQEQALELLIQKQKEKFAGFSFRVMAEKEERAQLKQRIMDVIVLLDEANAISSALDKPTQFDLAISSDFPSIQSLEDEQFEEGFGRSKRIKVEVRAIDLKTPRQFVFTVAEFAERLEAMRSIYQEQQMLSDDEAPPAEPEPESSPFFVPEQQSRRIGAAHVFLKDIVFMHEFERFAPILDHEGIQRGEVKVAVNRFYDGPDPTLSAGGPTEITVKLGIVRGIPSSSFTDVRCQYEFLSQEPVRTGIATISGDDLTFDHEHKFIIDSVSEQDLKFLETGALVLNVSGQPISHDSVGTETTGQSDQVEEYKMLASLYVQELYGTANNGHFKNVDVKEEPWGEPGIIFRLNRGKKNPRRILLSLTKLRDQQSIQFDTCDSVTIGGFQLVSSSTPSTLSAPASSVPGVPPTSPRRASVSKTEFPLKVVKVDKDCIEVEWDWAAQDKELAAILPAAKGGRRMSRSNTPTNSPEPAAKEEEPRLNAQLTFNLRLNNFPQPVAVTKVIGMKLYTVSRALSRTESEQIVLTQLNVQDPMSNEEERRQASGSHFSISVQRVREMKRRISAVIEEQTAYQKLVSAALLKEKLKAELSLHDKLSDESVALLRSPQVLQQLLADVERRTPTRSVLLQNLCDSVVNIKIHDLANRMESKMSGYLKRKSNKEWKRKWFTLSRNYLSVYKSESDEVPSSTLDLTNATVTEVPPTSYPFCFVVVSRQNAWFLQAESAEEYQSWLESLNPAKKLQETLENTEKALRSKLETVSKQLQDATTDNKSAKRRLVDLEETVRTREEEIVQLSDQLEDTKKELREKADAPVAVPAKDNTEELDSAKRQLLAQAKAIDDLESELKLVKARHEKKEKAVGELETELEDARKAYSELRRTKSRAANLTDDQPSQSDFERVSRRAEAAEAESDNLRHSITQLEELVERLKSESVEAPGRSNEFVSIRTQLQEARKELELAKLENGDLKGELERTKRTLKSKDDLPDNLLSQSASDHRRIIDAEELASGLQKEKRRLENLVDDMKAQLREASIGKRDDGGVKEQLWENRKEVEKLRIENEALQDSLDRMKRKTQAATAGKGKSSDEETEALLIEAEGEVRSLRKKLEDVQNRLMDYEDENEMLNRELKAKQRAIIELEDDVEELRRTNAGGDAREVGPATLRELRRQLREADDLALEKDRNARLTERELKKKIASKEREMIDLTDRLSRTEIAFDARKLTLTTLKSDVDIAKRDSEEKEAEIKQLKRDLKSLAASADELREAKVLSSDEVKRLKDKLKNSIDDAKEKDRTIDRLKSEITDLESKLTKMRSTEGSATLSRGASTYGIQRTSSSAQVTDDSSKSSDEVALLRRQIAAKDDALAALDSSASGDRVGTRLRITLDKLGRSELEKEELQKEIEKLKKDVRRAERENKYPDIALSARQRQIEGLVSIVDDKDDKNDDLRTKNTRLAKEVSAAKRDKEAAENEILLLRRAKNDLESRVKRLEARSLDEAGRMRELESKVEVARKKLDRADEEKLKLETEIRKLNIELDDHRSS